MKTMSIASVSNICAMKCCAVSRFTIVSRFTVRPASLAVMNSSIQARGGAFNTTPTEPPLKEAN